MHCPHPSRRHKLLEEYQIARGSETPSNSLSGTYFGPTTSATFTCHLGLPFFHLEFLILVGSRSDVALQLRNHWKSCFEILQLIGYLSSQLQLPPCFRAATHSSPTSGDRCRKLNFSKQMVQANCLQEFTVQGWSCRFLSLSSGAHPADCVSYSSYRMKEVRGMKLVSNWTAG